MNSALIVPSEVFFMKKQKHNYQVRALCFLLVFLFVFNGFPLDIGLDLFAAIEDHLSLDLVASAADAVDLDGSGFPNVAVTGGSIRNTITDIALLAQPDQPAQAYIALDDDYSDYSESIEIPDNTEIILDLCGHTVSYPDTLTMAAVITVYGTLKIVDTVGGGAFVSNGAPNCRGVDIVSGGKFMFAGGAIDGFISSSNGAGILVEENGYLNLAGGTVSNCRSEQQGGGVFVFNVKDVSFTGGEISHCEAENGGGISIYKSGAIGQNGQIDITDLNVHDNVASTYGGGLYIDNDILVDIYSAHFDNNRAKNGGGIYFNRRVELTVNGSSSISGNTASSDNTSEGRGGGIFFTVMNTKNASSFILNDGQINSNTSDRHGGGVYFMENNVNPAASTRNIITINGGQINENTALIGSGGGLYIHKMSSVTVTGGQINRNQAKYHGAGMFVQGGGNTNFHSEIVITGGEFCENTFDNTDDYFDSCGGGLQVGSYNQVEITGGKFNGNTNIRYGGGIQLDSYCNLDFGGDAEVCDNVLYHPYTSVDGGGIYMSGASAANPNCFHMTGGTISRNDASNIKGGWAGGIRSSATETIISGGVISDNICRTYGAGMCMGTATIEGDTVISGNYSYSRGGGVYTGSPLRIRDNVVFENNTANGWGGALASYDCGNGIYDYSLEISGDVVFRNNKILNSSEGGAIFAGSSGNWSSNGTLSPYTLSIKGGTFEGNESGSGGALFLRNSAVTSITGGSFINNTSTGSGGAIYFYGYLPIKVNSDKTYEFKEAPTLILSTDVLISGNLAKSNGGAISTGFDTQIILEDGARIINNTANNVGGGIYRSAGTNNNYQTDSADSIDIRGGELRNNNALNIGRDIYVEEPYPYYKWNNYQFTGTPYTKMAAASQMHNGVPSAYWLDEVSGEKLYGEVYTKDKVDSHPSIKYSAYSYNAEYDRVAKVGDRTFSTIQAAVNAIEAGECASSHIELLKSNRETVVIPDGLTCSLDLCGNSVFGEVAAVFKVQPNADFTVTDSVGGSVISDGKGEKLSTNNDLYGGAFIVYGKLSVSNVTLTLNKSYYGKAIYSSGGDVTVTDCVIKNNKYNNNQYYSAIYLIDGASLTMSGTQLFDNPGIAVDAYRNVVLNITDCDITDCTNAALRMRTNITADIERCNIHDNSNSGVYIESNASTVTMKECEIRGNNASGVGAGVNLNSGTLYLIDSVITDNRSSGTGGGIYMLGSGRRLFLKNSRIYANSASFAPDLYIAKDAQVHSMDDTTDYRAVENFGVSEYTCWYDEDRFNYVVNDADEYSSGVIPVVNVADLFDSSNNNIALGEYRLRVDTVRTDTQPVAEIVETGEVFYSLDSAFGKAKTLDGDSVIRMLDNVTESNFVVNFPHKVTLDLNGKTIRGEGKETRVFKLQNTYFTLKDSAGGGKIVPPDKALYNINTTRGIEVEGGTFVMESGEISGFEFTNYNCSGGALRIEKGPAEDPTKAYIRGGVFKDNSAYCGGAISILSESNRENIFELTGGTFINNRSLTTGGAIDYVVRNNTAETKFLIKGGTFTGNSAVGDGGAIAFSNNAATNKHETVIYGASFTGNTSEATGGALRVSGPGTKFYGMKLGDESVRTVFRNNTANSCGAVYCNDTNVEKMPMIAENMEFSDNRTTRGDVGALLIAGAYLTLKDCDFFNNFSGYSVSALRVGDSNMKDLTVTNCNVYNNEGTYANGAMYVYSRAAGDKLVKNCKIYNNFMRGNYGGLHDDVGNCSITYENCEIYGNRCAYVYGGNVYISGGSKQIYFKDCDIHHSPNCGIAFWNNQGLKLYIRNTHIHDNSVSGGGGGISTQYTNYPDSGNEIIIEEGTVIENNTATASGGGVWIGRGTSFTMSGGEIRNNSCASSGGGVCYASSYTAPSFTITGGSIKDNLANSYGGGVYVEAYPTPECKVNISNAVISGNTCTNSGDGSGWGGGLYLTYYTSNNTDIIKARINDTKILDNSAKYGGGFFVRQFVEDVVVSGGSVIYGNSAESYGGGVYVDGRRTSLQVNQKQIYGNTAMLGNDAYVAYDKTYHSAQLYLLKPSLMFDDGDEYEAADWLEEVSSAVYTEAIRINPLGRSYAYTLSYHRAAKCPVAVYNGVEYTSLQLAVDAVAASSSRQGDIILVDNAVESVTIPTGSKIGLNLNGHLVRGVGTSAITNRGELTITDDKQTVTVGANTYETVSTDGRITGTAAVSGGGIQILSGVVTLKGGTIQDCLAGSNVDREGYAGGGVAVSSGEFILDGGTVKNNVAYRGGGVAVLTVAGKFTMKSGELINNKCIANGDPNTKGYGGGIYCVGGKTNITGGTISGNAAYIGGAMHIASGSGSVIAANVADKPLIKNNSAGYRGGAISVNSGTLITANTEISYNRTTYNQHADVTNTNLMQSSGGGIYVGSSTADVILGDGTVIRKNSAVRGGGVYQFQGSVQISGPNTLITANRARMGGGCAMYPLPGNNTTTMSLTDEAAVYGNISTLTSAGNDFYSAWEGSNTYISALGNYADRVPRLNLIAASNMNAPSYYNVWKNDAYDGEGRTGSSYISGQYITAEIIMCNDVQLTASYYDVATKSEISGDFMVKNLSIATYTTGTKDFDDGLKHGAYVFNDASQKEMTAEDTLSHGGVDSSETYEYNGTVYNYIEYKGKLYERDQVITWWEGNDYSDSNTVVRSFDTITYNLGFDYESLIPEEEMPYVSKCHLKTRIVLPCNSDQAEFESESLLNAAKTPGIDEHGNEIQILTGYWEMNIAVEDRIGHADQNVIIKVKGMKNGATIKPKFEFWFEGNDTSPHGVCQSKTVTVSAAPKMNITLMNNESLTYEGYFDTIHGDQVSPEHAGESGVVYGIMLGYGVTVEMFNDPTMKGMKGLELPKDGVNFDMSFNGCLYSDSATNDAEAIPDAVGAPIIWAYKENTTSFEGRKVGDSADIFNLDWEDDDSVTQLTHYAYRSAPYNVGDNGSSCYSGGGWLLSDERRNDGETSIHAEIAGFAFNSNTNPNDFAGGGGTSILDSPAVKAFTSAYIQMIIPIDNINIDNFENGDYRIGMNAVAFGLDAESISGQKPQDIETASDLNTPEKYTTDLQYMNEYYGFNDVQELIDNGLAIGERRYSDNYSSFIRNIILSRQGSPDDILEKRNIFFDENVYAINGTSRTTDTGKGDTPLGSQVYIEGSAFFYSKGIDTSDSTTEYYMLNDPLYDTAVWNLIEYHYLTAVNILQKFDADAYTPVGAPAVINRSAAEAKDIVGDSFIISTTESKASWSDTATQNYNLTILYAAKPDGTNWVKAERTDNFGGQDIVYDDGGAADMELYKEENLVFFKTLDELHDCLGEDTPCVAILYQFRDCCIRTERSIHAKSKMDVTGEFEKVGQTYCTTNDVRGWTTYRPHYKVWYGQGTHGDHIYKFNWIEKENSAVSANGVTAYGAVLPPGTMYDGNLPYYTQSESGGTIKEYPITHEVYNNTPYVKTRYRNGVQVKTSHNGMHRGNTLLLYSLKVQAPISVYTKQAGSNTPKQEFNITGGERRVTYAVHPEPSIESSAKKTELVRNGTQSTLITLELSFDPHLHYQKGSIVIDYSQPDCGYAEGGLEWTETYDPVTNKAYLSTYVSDIDLVMPRVMFDCTIGDEINPDNDIKKTTSLFVSVIPSAEYSEYNVMATANTESSSVSITALVNSQEGISKSIDVRQYEIGEDIAFTLAYGNNVKVQSSNLETVDILPHNGDNRGTDFHGGYNVKTVSITFTSDEDYQNYVSSGTLWFAGSNVNWNETEALSDNSKDYLNGIMDGMKSSTHLEAAPQQDADTKTVTYDFSGQGIGTTRFNGDQTTNTLAPGLFSFIPTIQGEHRVSIKLVVTPMSSDVLISSAGSPNDKATQIGGDTYVNSFYYRKGIAPNYSVPLVSNQVSAYVVNRIISGTVWMDQDQDGMYNTAASVEHDNAENGSVIKVEEYPIKNVRAVLYYTNQNGTPDFTRTVKNVVNEDVQPVYTDSNGYYEFENLAQGEYTVVFTEETGYEYAFMNGKTNQEEHPIEFSKLSVTTDQHQLALRGNKCQAVYDEHDIARLNYAQIGGQNSRVISLPEKTKIPGGQYTSPNWNLGLYFIDFKVTKRWGNMTDLDTVVDIAPGTTIKFEIVGREAVSQNEVYRATITLRQTATGIESQFSQGSGLVITDSQDGDSFTWSFGENGGIYLQGRNANDIIVYTYNETEVKVNDVDLRAYYTALEAVDINDVTQQVTLGARNDRVLGSVTIHKTTGGGDMLEGAEFTIYQVSEKRDPNDDSYYSPTANVGTAPLDVPFGVRTTEKYYKVIIGDDDILNALMQSKQYIEYDNVLVSNGTRFIVHKQTDTGQYYYYTKDNTPFSYEYVIGNIDRYNELKTQGVITVNNKMNIAGIDYSVRERTVQDDAKEYYLNITLTPANYTQETIAEFPNLPLVDDNGARIYYTVRETGVPDGYYALGDFNKLTGIDLYGGGITQPHDYSFAVENTRQMQLPLTGSNVLRALVVLGTMMTILGAAAIFMMMTRCGQTVRSDLVQAVRRTRSGH